MPGEGAKTKIHVMAMTERAWGPTYISMAKAVVDHMQAGGVSKAMAIAYRDTCS